MMMHRNLPRIAVRPVIGFQATFATGARLMSTRVNYFNDLTMSEKLEQLGQCRFMAREEFADGITPLEGKKVVIVGCGAQGLNQGLNMRDSGCDVS